MNITYTVTRRLLLVTAFGLSILGLTPLCAVADDRTNSQSTLPSHWPSSFQSSGFARQIDGGSRTIIISGTRYYYGINTRVHTQRSNFASVSNINSGDELGFSYVQDSNKKRFLNEVWILPAGSLTDS